MIKQILTVAIVVIVATVFMADVCAQPVTELKFTTTVPDVSGLGRGQKAWIEKCEKDAG